MIVCIIQARMGSTRLPGKVLKFILEKPMLYRQIERVKRANTIDKIIIATTINKEDDIVASTAREAGVDCFRGSEADVLDRYYHAAKLAKADIIVRLTGDCPLSDPDVIDETVGYFLKYAKDLDYASKPVNYPEGLDVEVFTFTALERSWKDGKKISEREHVTPFIYTHPEIFRIGVAQQSGGKDYSKMHWSVDTAEDFVFVTNIFEALYRKNPFFSKDDIIKFLKNHPELLFINKGGTGYEGYKKSLKEDKVFQNKSFIYQKIIGFIPEVIFIISGGTVKDVKKNGLITYRSTRKNEGDFFGTLWGEARVIATAELALFFPKTEIKIVATNFSINNEPTQAEIIRNELEKLSVSRSRITVLGKKSKNTASQICECLKIIYNEKWRKAVIVTNVYHIDRVSAIYSHLDRISTISREAKKNAKFLSSEASIFFIGAELILPFRDKKYKTIIKRVQATHAYKRRIKNEKQGVAMILNGEYGKLFIKKDKKKERKLQ
ncbi:MAG: ElyC/SanA/YdcF family protein [Patescibacteria group bacterium]|nr:ElyC/SanA/YdcF family protein [Patescibacteria group bacterium]